MLRLHTRHTHLPFNPSGNCFFLHCCSKTCTLLHIRHCTRVFGMADEQDDFEMVDVTEEMEPVLSAQEEEEEEAAQAQVQVPMIDADARRRRRKKHKHKKKHRKRHKKHRKHRKRHSAQRFSSSSENEGAQAESGAPAAAQKPRPVGSDNGSIPSDSQVAAAPSGRTNKRGEQSGLTGDLVYLPDQDDAAPAAGVGPSNTTTSITTIIERSKDPAVIVERIKQFLICFPKHEKKKPKDYAVVFDIDETLLYTLDTEVGLQPVGHALYRFCLDQGFVIELVTARIGDPHGLQYLQEQLHTLQYTGYHAISMVNTEHKHDDSPALCKLRSRLDIQKPVILNVGNRLSDLFLTPSEDDCLLSQINGQTYYCFKGQDPDILCVKLPTN